MTIIVYNGNGIKLYSSQSIPEFEKYKITTDSGIELFKIPKFYKLSDTLQIIKHHKFISIISGHLASRGLSFVSQDYKLHLTDQYYQPSNSAHGETLLQNIRLFGCYNDITPNNPLTLWVNKKIWKCIREQHKILKKYINKVKDKDNIIEKLSNVKTKFPKKRFSRPSIMRGVSSQLTKDGFMQLKINATYDYN